MNFASLSAHRPQGLLLAALVFASVPPLKLEAHTNGDHHHPFSASPLPAMEGRLAEWALTPVYTLPAPHAVFSNGAEPTPEAPLMSRPIPPARSFLGEEVTDRFRPDLPAASVPGATFTIELWVSYHVNQVVGALATLADDDALSWYFGFHKGEVYFGHGAAGLKLPAMEIKGNVVYDFAEERYGRGAHRYWHHLVGTCDGETLRVYRNGDLIGEGRLTGANLVDVDEAAFEIAGYLARERHMSLGNLVKQAALFDRALSQNEIMSLLAARRALLAEGILYHDRLHFTTSAPHVAFPTLDGISLLWETDRPTAATVHWGTTADLGETRELPNDGDRLKVLRLSGLEPNTGYYYRVVVRDEDGHELDSGLLSFRTAPRPGDPVLFAALSDTEARPHVNAHLATLIWRESAQIVVNAGDVTDGGREPNRVEWTHEYFAGMGHLMARTPFLPVMGNGEDDFVWFEYYHALPDGFRSYYSHRMGDVEFFILDSNLDRRDRGQPDFRPQQRAWFNEALAASDAMWKVVAFHHPPLPERYDKIVADFVTLVDRHDVDLILLGHHHNYRRSWPLQGAAEVIEDGPVYIQLGGGGGNLSSRPDTADPRWAKTYQGFGYSMFRVHEGQLHYTMHDDTGAIRDTFVLTK